MATHELTTKKTIEETTTTTIRTIDDVIMPPELVIIDKQVYCTSQQIAKHFEKRHDNVLQDIANAIVQVQAANNLDMQAEQMFVKGFDEESNNLGFKVKRPMYHLSLDGFTFLVMGYNGTTAARYKLAYMVAFKKMRQLLHDIHITEKPVQYLSNAQVQELKAQVDHLARPAWMKEVCARVIWNRLRFLANADTQLTIPADQFEVLKAELRRMEHVMYKGSRGTDSLIELMNEIQEYAYREVLCLGTPLSGTTHKDWRKKFGSLIPQGMGWRKAALILDELKPELEPAQQQRSTAP